MDSLKNIDKIKISANLYDVTGNTSDPTMFVAFSTPAAAPAAIYMCATTYVGGLLPHVTYVVPPQAVLEKKGDDYRNRNLYVQGLPR